MRSTRDKLTDSQRYKYFTKIKGGSERDSEAFQSIIEESKHSHVFEDKDFVYSLPFI